MILLDALTAKDCFVVRAIKVLHTLRMLAAKLVLHALFVLVVEIEVTIRKLFVFLNYLVQNVDIQWQALCRVQVLNQLAANGAAYSILVM